MPLGSSRHSSPRDKSLVASGLRFTDLDSNSPENLFLHLEKLDGAIDTF